MKGLALCPHSCAQPKRASTPANKSVIGGSLTTIREGISLFADRAFAFGGAIEISRLKAGRHGTVRGYFDSVETAAAEVEGLGDLGEEGTYITLNPVDPVLLARANNRFEDRAATRAADVDVFQRLWLPIDVDPVRKAGMSSTKAEMAAACSRRDDIVAWLRERGWPEPVLTTGGNSGHALFAIEEPNDDDTAALIKSVLDALAAQFSTDTCKVDTSVHNAARIWTLPGSTKRKGENMPDRPHRVACIESQPAELAVVTRTQVLAVAAPMAVKRGRKKSATARALRSGAEVIDMQAEFMERGWYLNELASGKHAVRCPWSEAHSGQSGISETVIYEPQEDGEVWGFRCMHSHCEERSIKDVWQLFRPEEPAPEPVHVADGLKITIDDFAYVAPQDKFLCLPTRELWVRAAVDMRMPQPKKAPKASEQIALTRSVEQMSWLPGRSMFIDNCIVSEGGITAHPGYRVANLYREPEPMPGGNPADVGPWMDHLTMVYPDTFEHIINWCAHRVQRPHEKINHALVLGGKQGIGKDSLLEPLKQGVGPWNFSEIHPGALMGEFNGYLRSIVLRINEARDLGDANRYELYERSKTVTTGPPDTLRVNEKHTKEFHVPNVTGVIFTTNHRDGLWIPPDDRRHHVSWCDDYSKEDFNRGYWESLWDWYTAGGVANVVAFLQTHDISKFDAKNPPPKTNAWHEMISAGRPPEESELGDVLEKLGRPAVVSLSDIAIHAPREMQWVTDRKSRARIPHLMEGAGYRAVRRTGSKEGRWMVGGKRTTLYALDNLTDGMRYRAVNDYVAKLGEA